LILRQVTDEAIKVRDHVFVRLKSLENKLAT
jgi:hypothetical protein